MAGRGPPAKKDMVEKEEERSLSAWHVQPPMGQPAPLTQVNRRAPSPGFEYVIPRGPFPYIRGNGALPPHHHVEAPHSFPQPALRTVHHPHPFNTAAAVGMPSFLPVNPQYHPAQHPAAFTRPHQQFQPPPYPHSARTMTVDHMAAPLPSSHMAAGLPSPHLSVEACPVSLRTLIGVIPPSGATLMAIIDSLPSDNFPVDEVQNTAFQNLLASCTDIHDKVYKLKTVFRAYDSTRQASPAPPENPALPPQQVQNNPQPEAMPPPPPPGMRNGSKRTADQASPATVKKIAGQAAQANAKNSIKNSMTQAGHNVVKKSTEKPGPSATTMSEDESEPDVPSIPAKRGAPAHEETPPAQRLKFGDLKARKDEIRAQIEKKKARNAQLKQIQKEREEAMQKRIEAEMAEIEELERQNAAEDAETAALEAENREYEMMQAEKESDDEDEDEDDDGDLAKLNRELAEQDAFENELEADLEAGDLFMGL